MRPLYELAEQTGTTALTVKRRLAKLERDGIIIAYRLFLDLKSAGILYYKLHVALRHYTAKDLAALRTFVESKNSVIYTDHYMNGEEFEIELQVPSVDAYQQFFTELHERFGTIIRSSYLFEFTDRRLFRYLPLEKST
jgi:DNA-binding Lrp family transcriptional regulator